MPARAECHGRDVAGERVGQGSVIDAEQHRVAARTWIEAAADEIQLGRKRRVSALQLTSLGGDLIGDRLIPFGLCVPALLDSEARGTQGHDREHGQSGDGESPPPRGPSLLLTAGGQEGALVRVEVSVVADGPVVGDCQAGSTEQAAGIAPLRLPGHGSVGQFALGTLAAPGLGSATRAAGARP